MDIDDGSFEGSSSLSEFMAFFRHPIRYVRGCCEAIMEAIGWW
jgi:hypothetical protein